MKNKYIVLLLVFFLVPITHAAIAFDRSTFARATSGSSLTFSHTAGAGTDFIIVGTSSREATDANRPITNVSYAGSYLAKAREDQNDANDVGTGIWWRAAPATGANNIIINATGTITNQLVGFGITLSGVEQTNPIGNTSTFVITDTTNPFNYSLLTNNDNSWVVDVLYDKDDNGVSATGTEIGRNTTIGGPSLDTSGIGTQLKTTAGLTFVSWSRTLAEVSIFLDTSVELKVPSSPAGNVSCVINATGGVDYWPCSCPINTTLASTGNTRLVINGTGTLRWNATISGYTSVNIRDATCAYKQFGNGMVKI